MKLAIVGFSILLAMAAPAAATANLVTNGSFETNSFAGWTQVGDTHYSGVLSGFFYAAPTDGSHQARFGPTSGYGGLTQSVGTGGKTYRLSFDLGNNLGSGAVVSFGGSVLLTDPVADGGAFHHYSFLVTTTESTLLSFTFYNQPAWYTLDNVVVQGVRIAGGVGGGEDAGTVPDAPVWALFIAGFGLSGAALRRRVSVTARV